MTYNLRVKGNIITNVGGKTRIYAKEGYEINSNKSIIYSAPEYTFGDPEDPPTRKQEDIINISSELYMHNNQELKIPYLDLSKILNYKSSKPFISNIKSIFGDDIKHKSAKKLMLDLVESKVPYPEFEVSKSLSDFEGGYYNDGMITLSEKLILDSEKDPKKAWLLFRTLMEEMGHYIDDLLRNKYDNIGGDDPKDEGVLLTADFIKYNGLLFKSFDFATITIQSQKGNIREFNARVLENNPDIEEKAKDLLFVSKNDDDHGIITLKSGKKINVEFFKIKLAGAIHEDITKKAAKEAGVIYDYRLDEGCAWPDVPCEDQNSIETCYTKAWYDLDKKGTMAYESHNGTKQFWHSMAPKGSHTNQQVIDLIVIQAKEWFKKALETIKGDDLFSDDGLFHIGKILHMIQDSYSLSHVNRDSQNRIIQFQGYDAQDADMHGKPDKDNESKGVHDALLASVWILLFYKNEKREKRNVAQALQILENQLRTYIYPLAPKRGNVLAGGSLEAYKSKK